MPVALTHALLWKGVLDISQLDPSASSLKDLQIWGLPRRASPSYKTRRASALRRGAIKATEGSTEYEMAFAADGLRLSAVAYIDVASIRLWMVSGPPMEIFTTNAVTESFFQSVVASSSLPDASTLSRGIIVTLSPPDRNTSSLVIFGYVSPSPLGMRTTVDTDVSTHPAVGDSSSATKAVAFSKVTIKALPLNASCRLRSYVRHKRKRTLPVSVVRSVCKSSDDWDDEAYDYDNIDGVFLDASVEEVASTQKRNERLDQLLRRRTSIKQQQQQSACYTPAGSLTQPDSQGMFDSQHKDAEDSLFEDSLFEEQFGHSQQFSQAECLGPSVSLARSSQHYTNGLSSNSTLKTASTLQRVLLSALRLRGISRSVPQAASVLGDGSDPPVDSFYHQLFEHTYRATLFALRNRTSGRNTSRESSEETQEIQVELSTESGWQVRRMQRVVERILDIFLEADVEDTCF
ncbi:hypothetical protein V1525DRAFT_399615 [Lipomyces kononenkoae]|uniref:Uncharacterized protein n=1 Tax=Lipomyces kononenkoae TaxID=34357 RepID=A0ACC3T5I6_LIPKO